MRRVLLTCLLVLVGCGCSCSGCMCPNHSYKDDMEYVESERAARRKLTDPVVEALEGHAKARGRYPDRLDDLVTAGLLPAVPDLASNIDHLGREGNVKNAQPLQYAVVQDGYELRFSFGHVRPSLMAADSTHFLYASADKKWVTQYGIPARRAAPPKGNPPVAPAPAEPKEP